MFSAMKFLGVTLDDYITWKAHINGTAKKLYKAVFLVGCLATCVFQKEN